MVRFRYGPDSFRQGSYLYVLWPSDKTRPSLTDFYSLRLDPILAYQNMPRVVVQHYQVFTAERNHTRFVWEKDWQIDLNSQYELPLSRLDKAQIIDRLTEGGLGRGLFIDNPTFDPEDDI